MTSFTLVLLILSLGIAAGLAYLQYIYQAKNKSKLILFLAFLRFLVWFGIFLLLINPTITQSSVEIQKTPLAIVVDNSASIPFLKAAQQSQETYQKLVENSDLNEKFEIHQFQFDSDFKKWSTSTFEGKQSNLFAVAQGLKGTFKNRLHPTILLTDGNQTTGYDYLFSFKSENPVFPIVLGDTTSVFDLKINQLNVNKYAFLKNKFPVEAFIHYSGKKKTTATFSILNGKNVLAKQNVSFSPQQKIAVVNLLLPATKVGLQLYKAQISSPQKEKNIWNNQKNFAVEVLDQKTNIALISAMNHPDIGAIKRSVETNAQRKITVLNPNSLGELKDYNLVIFYQPNSLFQSAFEAVTTLGINSFIVTGTATDFAFLNKQQTDLQFKMSNQTEDYFPNLQTDFNLFALNGMQFDSFPPLQNSFGPITKSGNVSVLMTSKIRTIDTKAPLLAFSENQGKRKAFLLGENVWKWRAQSFLDTQSFESFDIFIDKIMQYLSSNTTKKSLVVQHELFYNSGDPIEINAQYFNKNYEFDENARLSIAIVNEKTKSVKNYDLVKGTNTFKVNLDGLAAGKYRFTVTELNSKQRYSSYFELLDFDIEKQFVAPDYQKLSQLASQTQGKVYLPSQLNELIQELVENENFKPIQKSTVTKTPLIDWVWLLFFLVVVVSMEWLIRKYNGLL